jgi:hypothetical protein
VSIGPQRIEFNAHRVFDVPYLLGFFGSRHVIDSFLYVNDDGGLFERAEFSEEVISSNFGCNFGCRIFEMIKV